MQRKGAYARELWATGFHGRGKLGSGVSFLSVKSWASDGLNSGLIVRPELRRVPAYPFDADFTAKWVAGAKRV